MRLALFTDSFAPQQNGVSRTLERLVRETEIRGGAACVFTVDDPRAPRSRNGHVHRTASVALPHDPEIRISLPSAGALLPAVAEFAPSLVHAATPFGVGLAGRRVARLAGIPFVTSYHASFAAYTRYYRLGALAAPAWRYLRWFHNASRRTFCPTMAAQRELRDRGFRRLALWGRGVDTARFSPSFRSRAMRLRVGVDDDTIVVAYAGRIAREKGIESLLGAMGCLRHLRSDLVFAFAGDGPYLEHCRTVAPGRAIFLGRLEGEALSAFYSSADIAVFPSSTDTFGDVLVEAMASGLPVVAADCASTREIVGATGTYHAPDDVSQLSNAILSLVVNAPRRRALGRAARIRSSLFGWGAVFDDLFTEYESALAGRDPVRLPSPGMRRSGAFSHAPR